MKHSIYYQAHVKKDRCWILSSCLKFTEYVAFDRTIDRQENLFEFFVSPDLEPVFLQMMAVMVREEIIFDLKKLPNRFILRP